MPLEIVAFFYFIKNNCKIIWKFKNKFVYLWRLTI